MDEYGPATYGDKIAGIYDNLFAIGRPDPGTSVAVLAELAGNGPVLELGIGTGRLALPLAERGIEIHGIDASEAMLEQLREKPGGADVPVTVGNFKDVPVEGEYALVFVAYNTFFGLASQDEQVRCFENVAAHLSRDGTFVIEAFVPDMTRWNRNQTVEATAVHADRVAIEVSRHDPVEQRIVSHQVVIADGGAKLYPVQVRYAWPSELDLMARLAGLVLRERWANWKREPFTSDSTGHVSVYEKNSMAS